MKARLATVISHRHYTTRHWGTCTNGESHCASNEITGSPEIEDKTVFDKLELWNDKCDKCGEPCPEDTSRGHGPRKVYDTPSGELEPGCLYWVDYLPENMHWDNHIGPMLHAVLPNGYHWNIDSRASNCTMKDDKTHRCWVRHGSPEEGNVHVDKNGHTCSAGAGSIVGGDWHGFLHNGNFVL